MSKFIGNIILEGAATVEDSIIVGGSDKRRVEAEGTFQDLGVENRNRRIYEEKDMRPEIYGSRIKELIKAKSFKGEYGHPLSNDLVRQQTIDPKLTCCRINDIWIKDNLVQGRFQGTNNAYGEEFDLNLRDGELPAFSLRALGSIENRGGKAYVKNIRVITYDVVIFPSHKVAYTSKLVTEGAGNEEIVNENQIIVPNNDPGTIIKLTDHDAKTVINRLQRESASISAITDVFEGLCDNVTLMENGKLMLSTRFGEKIYVNLENHVDNIIMDYVFKM